MILTIKVDKLLATSDNKPSIQIDFLPDLLSISLDVFSSAIATAGLILVYPTLNVI